MDMKKHSRSKSDSSLCLLYSNEDSIFEGTIDEAFGVIPMRRVSSSIPVLPSGPPRLPAASPGAESHTVDEDSAMEWDSDEDLLESVYDDSADENGSSPLERLSETPGNIAMPAVENPSNSPQNQLDVSVSAMAPLPLRRVLSTPTQSRDLPLSRTPSLLVGVADEKTSSPPIGTKQKQKQSRRISFEEPVAAAQSPKLSSPYALRRHSSTPVTPAECFRQFHRARTHSSSSQSSESSADSEQEMTWLTAPKQKKDINRVFRSPKVVPSSGLNTQSANRAYTLPKDALAAVTSTTGVVDPDISRNNTRRRNVSVSDENDDSPGQESLASSRDRDISSILRRNNLSYVVYLSAFAMFGEIIRVYLSRLFGFDCEFPDAVNDFLSPLSGKICITATGRTLQTGGALFIDLPANMLGSFLLGLVTSLAPDIWPPLPWLRDDHPLQRHDALHVAIKTGLCGSLTTFASWNSQMVVMLDGTATELGSQILPALSGYLLGLYCAVASFVFGNHVSTWLNRWKSRVAVHERQSSIHDQAINDMEEGGDFPGGAGHQKISNASTEAQAAGYLRPPLTKIVVHPSGSCRSLRSVLNGRTIPFFILAVIFVLFVVADAVFGIQFYRTLWMSTLFTPPGALLRWSFTKWNYKWFNQRLGWVPWGTVVANLLGCMLSALLVAIETRYVSGDQDINLWVEASIGALRVGFAGSLSTVSTFVQELVDLSTHYPQHAKAYYYAFGTVLTTILLGVSVYIPVVRGA